MGKYYLVVVLDFVAVVNLKLPNKAWWWWWGGGGGRRVNRGRFSDGLIERECKLNKEGGGTLTKRG